MIEEAVAAKSDLEHQIAVAVKEFEDLTGLVVKSVELERITIGDMAIVTGASAEVRLP